MTSGSTHTDKTPLNRGRLAWVCNRAGFLLLSIIPLSIIVNISYLFLGTEPERLTSFLSHEGLSRALYFWLYDRALVSEANLFGVIVDLLSRILKTDLNESSINASIVESLSAIVFVCCALWRVWIVAAIGVVGYRVYKWSPHWGGDILGKFGKGIFFSGVHIRANKFNSSGAPLTFATGLASLRRSTNREAENSPLSALLRTYGALNLTTEELVKILVAAREVPGFSGPLNENHSNDSNLVVETCSLEVVAVALLSSILQIQANYRVKDIPETQPSRLLSVETDGELSIAQYALLFGQLLERTLPLHWKEILGRTEVQDIAAAVLGAVAGNILCTSKSSGRWHLDSLFPGLSARAVIHSIPSFGDDYSYEQRENIRRAFVYANRTGPLGQISLPKNISHESLVLRHIVELTLSRPQEILACADDLELFALTWEAHTRWKEAFLRQLTSQTQPFDSNVFITQDKLLIVEAQSFIRFFSQTLDSHIAKRLEEVVSLSYRNKRMREASREIEFGMKGEHLDPAILHTTPMLLSEIKDVSDRLHIPVELVKYWSSARVMLSSFGWLSYRLNDHRIADHGLVKITGDTIPANQIWILLHTDAFRERFGENWFDRFPSSGSVAVISEGPQVPLRNDSNSEIIG